LAPRQAGLSTRCTADGTGAGQTSLASPVHASRSRCISTSVQAPRVVQRLLQVESTRIVARVRRVPKTRREQRGRRGGKDVSGFCHRTAPRQRQAMRPRESVNGLKNAAAGQNTFATPATVTLQPPRLAHTKRLAGQTPLVLPPGAVAMSVDEISKKNTRKSCIRRKLHKTNPRRECKRQRL
jgi:hypothetical protein